jgi:outer membrane protein TolC
MSARPGVVAAWLLCMPAGLAAAPPSDWYQAALQHPAVQAAEQNAAASTAGVSAARLAYLGGGAAFAGQTHTNDPQFVGVFTPQAFAAPPFADEVTRYGLQYRLPLDFWGAIAAARRAAQANAQLAAWALRQQQLEQLHAVTAGFVQLVALREQQAVLDTQAERVGQTLSRVRLQIDNGDAAAADLRLAEAEQARIAAETERLGAARLATLAQLSAAIGHGVDDPGGGLPALPDWPELQPDSALPVLSAQAGAEAAHAEADRQRRSLYPSVAAVGDYQRFEGDGDALPEAWSIGAQLSIPIDPSGWRRASAARLQAEAADDQAAAALRGLQAQWALLGAQYRSALAEAQAVTAERDALAEVVSVRAELHRVGLLSTEDLLRQQRELRAAESQLAELRGRALLAWSAGALLAGMTPEAYWAAMTAG